MKHPVASVLLTWLAAALCHAEVQVTPPPALPWSGASEALIAAEDDPWITPAEQASFATTPSYSDTRRYLERLVEESPLLTLEPFGTSAEGRELYYVRARPRKAEAPRPVVLIQAGIHAHEIDGKDAGLMLLRDIALRGKEALVATVDFVFVPIYNVDGHERRATLNGPHLRGPGLRGMRDTAQAINLNRDYAKADAPETRAMLKLIRALDPVLYIDVHVSDGFDHAYDVTYTYAGWGHHVLSPTISEWLTGPFETQVNAHLRSQGHNPHFYPAALDGRDLTKGLRVSAEGPRWSTGYGDHRRMPTVLVEMHHLKPYRQRVLGAYHLMEGALRAASDQLPALQTAIATDRAARPKQLPVGWERDTEPFKTIPFEGVAYETFESPASGRSERRFLGRTESWTMPVTGQHPTMQLTLPRAWWVPASEQEALELLALHGIEFERIKAPRTLDLDTVRFSELGFDPVKDTRVRMTGTAVHVLERVTLPKGSARVPFDQDLGLLAAGLLEPEAIDSLFAWGFFPEMTQPHGDLDALESAPLADAMLAADPELRSAFEAKLSEDKAFAADPRARLAWFVARSPYADRRYRRYPIYREVQ
ncbi:MAG: M14 family metallopeptidase [Pseudomonadota bacterium]